jgi:hypothetical protein
MTVAPGSEGGNLRASDEDREAAALQIREHYAAGRLDDGELSSRLSAVYGAKTQGDLAALRADLPALPPTVAAQKAALVQRRSHLTRRLLQQGGASLGLFVMCTVIWAASGASGFFWPVFTLFALGPLLRSGWSLYGPAPELDRVEQHLKELETKKERERRRHEEHRERQRRRHDRL